MRTYEEIRQLALAEFIARIEMLPKMTEVVKASIMGTFVDAYTAGYCQCVKEGNEFIREINADYRNFFEKHGKE